MNRKTFIKKTGSVCLGILSAGLVFNGCIGTRYVNGVIEGSFLIINVDSFIKANAKKTDILKYIVVLHEDLQYPIVVYRHSADKYQALLMRCTHQGTELQVFGNRLECPAHGSVFTNNGQVQNGPADTSLRSFSVRKEFEILKIKLS